MISTIRNDYFTARIDSVGAQLISLKDAAGREYIWQRDPAYWTSCSPLLFPSVGNCRNGRTQIEGNWYDLPKHGFCRTADFTITQPDECHVVCTLGDSADTHRIYPYEFKLSLSYALQPDGLFMDYQVDNTDNRTIHYLLGAHPGFNCPMESGERFEDYILEFEHEETASSMTYDLASLQFNAEDRKLRLDHSRILPLNYEMFSDDAVFFDSLISRKVALKNPATGKGVEVDFRDFETIAFWTTMPSQGPYLCFEPWNGSAIRSDEDDDFLHRHFLQSLEPDASKKYHLGIRIL